MKKDHRKKDIKSKLLAAIAMLMVSCIMLVSSTYAWFTLSTAPEVTGISTAIGANGNLEMALLPSFNDGTAYTNVADALAAIGDAAGNLSTVQANTTWGNLVDLSDSSYGLEKIALFPSKLGMSSDKLARYYLGYPQYGSDGRFNGTIATTASTAIHKNDAFGTVGFGVRAVGTSSGMTARELAYREALSAANDAFNTATTQTKNGASEGGSALASLAVSKSTGTTEFSQTDVSKLVTAYTSIQTALGHIETALRQYVVAVALMSATDEGYTTVRDAVEAASLDDLKTHASAEVGGYIDALKAMQTEVKTSLEALNNLTPGGTGTKDGEAYIYYKWEQLSGYVTALADVDKMKLNKQPISYYLEKDADDKFIHINELMANMNNMVLEVYPDDTLAEGEKDGLYVRMADFVNDFTTPVTISGVSYGGLTADNLPATMKVYKSVTAAYLPAAQTVASTVPDKTFGTGGSTLSDFYGYIIDMAFRTNAADSSLQLQTEAADRIYDGSTSPDASTMGGGSSMTYTITDTSKFSVDQLKKLMSYIRVVFFDPVEMTILGEARLDAANARAEENPDKSWSVTMDLRMWNAKAEGGATWATNSAITPLVQNVAKAVSTLVYLDGETLSNADVANADLTGKMNIQFSSSAKLVPMEYGDLLNGKTEEKSEYTVTVNGVQAEQKVAKGASYSYNIPSEYSGYTITVKMGGTEVPDAVSGGVITIANVTGNIEITATAPASGG